MLLSNALFQTPLLAQHSSKSGFNNEKDHQLLFRLSFDKGFKADAKGSTEPTNTENLPSLVSGLQGKGAFFSKDQFLRFLTKDNLNLSRGSISIWIKNTGNASKSKAVKHLFQMDGQNDTNTSLLSVGILHDYGAFVETSTNLQNKRWRTGFSSPIYSLKETNRWHQLVFTWDYTRGVKIFIDGNLVLNKLLQKADINPYEAFFIGGSKEGANGMPLVVDEFSLYNYELEEEEVSAEFLKLGGKYKTTVKALDPFLTAGKKEAIPVLFYNKSNSKVKITSLSYTFSNLKQVQLQNGKLADFTVPAKIQLVTKVLLNPVLQSGEYLLSINYKEDGNQKKSLDTISVLNEYETADSSTLKRTLVTHIKAYETKPSAEFGKNGIVNSTIGSYRETGMKKNDRFSFGFNVQAVNELHEAVILYPDDKARTIEVVLQDMNGARDYQGQSGVFTGNEYPLSGKMKEHRFFFWPHSKNQSIIFMTTVNGQPAAVHDIKIYKLNNLPPLSVSEFKGSVPSREIGIYYEDPVLNRSFGTEADFNGFAKATDRLIDYMDSFGQNTFHYPIAWYEGPHYGTIVERHQPNHYSGQGGVRERPEGFVRYLMKRLHAKGMKFNAGLHLHTLQSLENIAITDRQRIDSGEETVLNIKADGKLWYAKFHGSDPGFNPLDTRVQQAVKNVVLEVGERYGSDPSFTGVTLNIERVSIFTFGSIESGYNDINLKTFQQETGIIIPTYVAGDPDRFSESYKWLMNNPVAKEEWIDWRCRKIHSYYKEIASELSKYGDNVKLTLSMFPHFFLYKRLTNYLSESPLDVLRETGIDPRLYSDDKNIILGFTFVPADLRWRQSKNDSEVNIEANRTVFNAPEILEEFAKKFPTEVTIHDRYWEDPVGRVKPLKGFSDRPSVTELGWRVSTLNATGYHSLEPYVNALNNLDAIRITKGGFLIGTYGMEENLADFSKAFRALPAVQFNDVKGLEDPVRVRQAVVDGKLYFYVLNRLPMPVQVDIKLFKNGSLTDITNQKEYSSASELPLSLKPFDLRVFRSDVSDQKITGGQVTVLDELRDIIEQKFKKTKEKVNSLGIDSKLMIPYKPYFQKAQQCWNDKAYARLYFLLQESWVKDLERLPGL